MKIHIALILSLFATSCPPGSHAANAPRAKPAPKVTAPAAAAIAEPPALFPMPATGDASSVSGEMRFVAVGHITFATNKWDITDASKPILDQAATYLAVNQGAARLLIRGHTDEVGSVRFNDGLSNKRAAAVREYFVKKGVNVQWVRWEGHGEHAPIDENWHQLGRARNRQVELFAIYPPPAAARP